MLMGEIEELPTVFPNLSSWWNFVVKLRGENSYQNTVVNGLSELFCPNLLLFVVFISSCLRDIFNSVVSNNKARN